MSLVGGQACDDLPEVLHPGRRLPLGLLAPVVVAEVPEVELVERRQRVLGAGRERLAAQVGVDAARGLLAVPDPDRDRALARHRVAAGEHAGRPGHERGPVDLDDVTVELHPGQSVEEAGVALLAEGEDDGVGLELLEAPGAVGLALLVELLDLDRQVAFTHRADRAQPVDPDALRLGVGRLVLVRGHLLAGPAVDDDRVVGPEPAGDPGGVHGGVAAAVDRDPAGQRLLLPGPDVAEEADGVEDPAGVGVRDVDPLAQVRADRDEDRVEALPLGLEVGDPVLLLEDDAHGRDPGDLRVEDVARQPIGRDAVAHHPARQRSVVADDDVVPEPGQVVGGREPGRAGADDEHPATAADLRNGELPASARWRGHRGSARPRGSTPRRRAPCGCSSTRTGGSRPGRGSRRTGCRRSAAARHPRPRRPRACASQAWMFSPAGQASLHGGSRST